ncbi:hypothetical protein K431DRAFT_281284 [Polychaeton citri CBS 116435]|uniref:N-acetylglucosamine-induced protein 1 n=1 Tax=Polychaeton citri CBS 116435 TaxID=1314669 RepID=A0A9P4QI52_9PEZI|nr:hypothetical protein K431DRAFT_281284 [Polychaeton citri CBS 116435]
MGSVEEDTPFPLTAIDRSILATRDEDFQRTTWEDLKNIIANNTLEELKRLPSDLRRYLAWSYDTKKSHGSIPNFVLKERLHWRPITSNPMTFSHYSDVPFEDSRDYAVLVNDWPYGFEPGIVHILVWTKIPIAVDDGEGDVTPESRQLIERFVQRFFVDALGKHGSDNVLWFKNWVRLQSVRGLDHVHVLVRDVPQETLNTWTVRKDI